MQTSLYSIGLFLKNKLTWIFDSINITSPKHPPAFTAFRFQTLPTTMIDERGFPSILALCRKWAEDISTSAFILKYVPGRMWRVSWVLLIFTDWRSVINHADLLTTVRIMATRIMILILVNVYWNLLTCKGLQGSSVTSWWRIRALLSSRCGLWPWKVLGHFLGREPKIGAHVPIWFPELTSESLGRCVAGASFPFALSFYVEELVSEKLLAPHPISL